jgi:hypothetical protein
MKLFASLDAKDRKMLMYCLVTVVLLAFISGFLARNQNRDDNPVPGTYLTGKHGARAAYDMLVSSGYNIQRWEQPLSDLAAQSNAQSVLILAEPMEIGTDDYKAVDAFLKRGGRVLVTGISGGQLLPDGAVQPSSQFQSGACKLTPEGLDALADSGEVWMEPSGSWQLGNPRYRVEYNCADAPAVVEYAEGASHVVWWASSTPLENGSISRGANLNFFLNSLGPRDGHTFYWDESLHGESPSEWSYARGPAMNLLLGGLAGIGLLVVFSFSRRRGPVRDLPLPVRATPVEFLEALGSLYAKAGASQTAVELAYDRFRRMGGSLCGLNGLRMSASELAQALLRRFPQSPEQLDADLTACAEACSDEKLSPRRALALVQTLNRHGDYFASAARAFRSG